MSAMNITELLNGAGAVFGLIALLASAAMVVVSKRDEVTKQILNENNAALESQAVLLKSQLEERTHQLQLAEGKASALENVVTQGPAISKLSEDIGTQHKEILQSLASVANGLSDLARSLNTQIGDKRDRARAKGE